MLGGFFEPSFPPLSFQQNVIACNDQRVFRSMSFLKMVVIRFM
jgi:hypothetical protein